MSNNASFLPDDYLSQKAERRTNFISLGLFVVVMLGVFMAFLFTNQKWSQVKQEQATINVKYQKAASDITELMELETQKEEMLHKAELAAALVERVPRSVLLAELVNRMPEKLSLIEFELTSEKIKPIVQRIDPDKKGRKRSRMKPTRAPTKEDAQEVQKKIRPPKYDVAISLVGVAPRGQEVTRYLAELNAYALLYDVSLEYSEQKEIEGQTMQKFNITMKLNKDADVRDVDPLIVPRGRDPMSDELRLRAPGAQKSTVQATPDPGEEG
ncbi:MAG: hypothetical protein HKO59_14630 [Phycisphaerales bacterium]|nr:PilN domain-containing protein [Phycisphaerae bacterium]NNF43820.1 hypothetical protein [Phycisphaerales bacterium]NNM27194.1 hypothetical protein [Phycisphaerales bacterium]